MPPLLEGSSTSVSPISAKRNHVKMNHDDQEEEEEEGDPCGPEHLCSNKSSNERETVRKREKSRFFASRLASQFERAASTREHGRGGERGR